MSFPLLYTVWRITSPFLLHDAPNSIFSASVKMHYPDIALLEQSQKFVASSQLDRALATSENNNESWIQEELAVASFLRPVDQLKQQQQQLARLSAQCAKRKDAERNEQSPGAQRRSANFGNSSEACQRPKFQSTQSDSNLTKNTLQLRFPTLFIGFFVTTEPASKKAVC